MVLFFPCSCRRYLTVLRRGLSTDCKGSVDGAAALHQGQRVQEIGYLVGILASKANGMMDLDRRWLVRLPVVNCLFASRTGCDCPANHVSWPTTPQQRTQAMPTITGHFEAVVRGEQHCVSFIFDSDDKEGCYECIEVAVSGLTLKPGERKRLVSKACELAAHRLWRGAHGRTVSARRRR